MAEKLSTAQKLNKAEVLSKINNSKSLSELLYNLASEDIINIDMTKTPYKSFNGNVNLLSKSNITKISLDEWNSHYANELYGNPKIFIGQKNDKENKLNKAFNLGDKVWISNKIDENKSNIFGLEPSDKKFLDAHSKDFNDVKSWFVDVVKNNLDIFDNNMTQASSLEFEKELKRKVISTDNRYNVNKINFNYEELPVKSQIKVKLKEAPPISSLIDKQFNDIIERVIPTLPSSDFETWHNYYKTEGKMPLTQELLKGLFIPEVGNEFNKYASVIAYNKSKGTTSKRTYLEEVKQLILDGFVNEYVLKERMQTIVDKNKVNYPIRSTASEATEFLGQKTIDLNAPSKSGSDINDVSVKQMSVDEIKTTLLKGDKKKKYFDPASNGWRTAYDFKEGSKNSRWELVLHPDSDKPYLVDVNKIVELVNTPTPTNANKSVMESTSYGEQSITDTGKSYYLKFSNPAVIPFNNLEDATMFLATQDAKYLPDSHKNIWDSGSGTFKYADDAFADPNITGLVCKL